MQASKQKRSSKINGRVQVLVGVAGQPIKDGDRVVTGGPVTVVAGLAILAGGATIDLGDSWLTMLVRRRLVGGSRCAGPD